MKTKTKENPLQRAVRRYIRSNFMPIPVATGKKAPSLLGWQKRRISEKQVKEYFSEPGNVGLLLGKPSRGLVDVDLDAPEAAAVADIFLPPTNMIHGRKSKPKSHRYYRDVNPPAPLKFTDTDGLGLLEIRSTGQQTIVPPSIHPSGEQIRWEEEGAPKKLKAETLISRVKLVAVSALLARHYPEPGTRHEFVMALAGMLLQSQWPVEKVSEFINATARAAGDEEWKARARDVTSTAARAAEEKPVTGVTRLKELVGEEVIARLRQWLDLSERGSEVEHLTDLGNAGRFVAQHRGDVRFCHIWRKWLLWDGTRWRTDESGEAERRAKHTVRRLYEEASRVVDDDRREETGEVGESIRVPRPHSGYGRVGQIRTADSGQPTGAGRKPLAVELSKRHDRPAQWTNLVAGGGRSPRGLDKKTNLARKRETTHILSLIRRAEVGDKAATAALRQLINQAPGAWEMAGNLATRAENALVSVAAGKDEILKEALTRKLATLKEELGGGMPLERLLVERLVACWLNVYYIDALYAKRLNDVSWAEGEYFQRRQERAHRQYLLAIRTLAQVRRLLVPAVQVNIGTQQLNVAKAPTCKQR